MNQTIEKDEIKNVAKKRKSFGKIIFDIVFWLCVIILAAVWLTDFYKMKNSEKPIFCIKEKVHEFDDGTVNECVGLGYKIYEYNRDSIHARQFGPFFIGMQG